MNPAKEARIDAREYARAKMYYGDGAGIRRRLIEATVEDKAYRDPAYGRAFRHELNSQDMAEHAIKARRERELRDRSHSVSRNVKGLATGNYQSVSSGVMVAIMVGYFAHQTGLDKVAVEKSKELYTKGERKVRSLQARYRLHKMKQEPKENV